MLKTIQIKLIHLLGGYTKYDYKVYSTYAAIHNHSIKEGFNLGIIYLAKQLEHIAIQNYGCSKQEWIDKIYFKIQDALKGNVK